MLKKLSLFGIFFLLAVVLVWNPLYSQKPDSIKKTCCIAGTYKGEHEDTPSLTCPDPKSGKITMVINQDTKCGKKIWGTVTGEDGTVQKFAGTLTPTKKGCCKLKAKVVMPKGPSLTASAKPPETTEIEGEICKKKGKWVIENGTYVSSGGCTGTFTLKQD